MRKYTKDKDEQKRRRVEYQRAWRTKNKDYFLRYYRERTAEGMLRRARDRAQKKGIPFDLTLEDIVIPARCPILGMPLLAGGQGERGSHHLSSPSLDRIDNTQGYVRGNVVVISSRANTLKRDATLEEVQKLAAWMEENMF